MGKIFGMLFIAGIVYVAMTIHDEGMDQAFGGVFAPIESQRDSSTATALTPLAQSADVPGGSGANPSRRLSDGVRQRAEALR